jgi:chromosome segregation ATPase
VGRFYYISKMSGYYLREMRKTIRESVEFDALTPDQLLREIDAKANEIRRLFAAVAETASPGADGALDPPIEKTVLTEEWNSVKSMIEEIERNVEELKALIKRYNEKTSKYTFNLKNLAEQIETIELNAKLTNSYVKKEAWFNSFQGTNLTEYRKLQLAYDEYIGALNSFFDRMRANPELKTLAIPVIPNLLNRKALSSS